MKMRVVFDDIAEVSHDRVEKQVGSWVARHLDDRLQHFNHYLPELSVYVARLKKNDQHYEVRGRLHLPPKKVLVAHATAAELDVALATMLEHLLRQVDRHIKRIRHQEAWKRKARRQRLHELKARAAEPVTAAATDFVSKLESALPKLRQVVRRELAFLRAQGDLPADYPSVDDVVDEVLLLAETDADERSSGISPLSWLLKKMHTVLDREIDSTRVYGELVSLESAVPQDALDQAEAMVEEEVSEYWQPDESLRIEDIVPQVNAADPEAAAAASERMEYLFQLLRGLPIRWRRAVLLHEIDGLPVEHVAQALDESVGTVQAWLAQSTALLTERLQESGFVVEAGRSLFDVRSVSVETVEEVTS